MTHLLLAVRKDSGVLSEKTVDAKGTGRAFCSTVLKTKPINIHRQANQICFEDPNGHWFNSLLSPSRACQASHLKCFMDVTRRKQRVSWGMRDSNELLPCWMDPPGRVTGRSLMKCPPLSHSPFLTHRTRKSWESALATFKSAFSQDFPGGPVVKNLPCNSGGEGSIPGQGTKIPHPEQLESLCSHIMQLRPDAGQTKKRGSSSRVSFKNFKNGGDGMSVGGFA